MRRVIVALLSLILAVPLTSYAQTSEPPPPESSAPEVAPPPAPAPTPAHHRKKTRKRHKRRTKAAAEAVETTVEPASARVKVKDVAPVHAHAGNRSETIDTLAPGNFVQVTGSTKSFLQIQLKDGRVGYISPLAVYIVTPQDKQFLLTADSPVYSVPNQWGKKLADVHRGKYVHVIGSALSYVKIQMKDGTQGYIPMTALQ
jgi:Bacterial SH3 domain